MAFIAAEIYWSEKSALGRKAMDSLPSALYTAEQARELDRLAIG